MAIKSGGPILSTSGYTPFTKVLRVNGLKLIILPAIGGATAVSDAWTKKVAKTIQLMFGSGGSIDSTDQLDTMTQMSNRSTVQRLGYSSPGSYSPSVVADNANDNYPGIDYTGYINSMVDYIWEVAAGNDAVMEVVEHLLHTITVFGLQHSYPTKMNQTNQTSDIYLAMQQAITTNGSDGNPIFDTSGYSGSMSDPDFRALLMREYYYLLVAAEWGYISTFSTSLAPEWNDSAINSAGVQTYNALGHQLYLDTAAKVLTAPDTSTMSTIFASGDNSGYQEDVGSLQISGVDFSGTVTAG
jgi:hypothetical protein|tara:strand:- start:102 stop:998 length:897 start_codon:yes stop_codon:yes gene_type:complete